MDVRIEVSDAERFKQFYSKIANNKEIIINDDDVAYGIEDTLIIGLVFIYNASLSGFTWDIIKEQMFPYIKSLFGNKRKQDKIVISIQDTDDTYDLKIPENYNEVNIEIPNKLKMKLKK